MNRFFLRKMIWIIVLFSSKLVFSQNAQKISPDGYSFIDPEFLSSEHKMAFQMGNGQVWLADLDSITGLLSSPTGLDLLIDIGATPLVTSFNGPEFGVDSNGWSLVYTKPNGGIPQAWRAIVNGSNVTNTPLTSGLEPRLSILASKNSDASSTKILFSKGESLSNGVFGWTDVNDPANETIIDSTDNGVRWIDNSQKFFYIKKTGDSAGQVFLYDTESLTDTQVTNDSEPKTYIFGWYAPEYNELIFLSIINETELGIYKNNGTQYWEKIYTIEVPPASNFDYIGSPEAFVVNSRSYISFVTKVVATGSNYVSAEVWLVDIEPDISNRFMLRCDDGLPNTKRTDPESYIGTNEVFIYYNQINSLGEFEVWRYATGIPVSTSTSIEVENSSLSQIIVYPNPTTNYINLKFENLTAFKGAIYDFYGRHIKSFVNTKDIYVGDLSNGIYILKIHIDDKELTYKLIKE
jgi:hypothetical protein